MASNMGKIFLTEVGSFKNMKSLLFNKKNTEEIPRWQLEGGSKKRAS
jgi:hypothetical protein